MVAQVAQDNASLVSAAGHAGDGNIHLSVFQPDAEVRERVMHGIFDGRHGAGRCHLRRARHRQSEEEVLPRARRSHKIALMQRIKLAFDPNGILNPGTLID